MDKQQSYNLMNGESLAGRALRVRLLYMIGVGVLGYLTFMALIVFSAVQLIYAGVTKSRNEELAQFNRELLGYLTEILAFIGFLSDKPPFPFAPFPGAGKDRS